MQGSTPQQVAGALAGKVAVITGAAQGIGLAIARRFHSEGAQVVIADRSGLQDAIAAELGERALALQVDVGQSVQVKQMIDAAIARFGGIDILCNNAGIDGQMRPLAEFDEAQFDHVIAINLRGVFLGLRHGIPALQARGGGSIINIASVAGITALPGLGPYGASKAGVIQLTRSAALEYARDGIRVNVICPGMIATALTQNLSADHAGDAARVLAATPLGRVGQADEIAATAVFLASSQSSYMTGASLPVDGGYTIV